MSSHDYQIRPYEPGDERGIVDLFNLVFGEDDAEFKPRTLAEWRWEYADNPAGLQIIVAATRSGEIIAHYGGLPARYWIKDRTAVCGQGVDSMVHPDWRRGLKKEGPFLGVARAYFATFGVPHVNPFTFGYPNRKAIRIGRRLLGYVPVVEQLPTLYRNFFEHPDDQDMQLEGPPLKLSPIRRFGADADELWNRLRKLYPLAIIRDQAYLNWRYLDCRLAGYRAFGLYDDQGTMRGWFVAQPQWQQKPIFALVDFFAHPEDEAALRQALLSTVEQARQAEHARVEAWFPESYAVFANARKFGFKSEFCDFVLCIRIHEEALDLDRVGQHWYYTIGDSDIL